MADRKYRLTFQMGDGTKHSVEVLAPQGEPGEKGDPGVDGKSAYEYAVDGGYEGTEEEFAATIVQAVEGNPGVSFETDATLKLENGVLSVNTVNAVEEDNTLPVTSAAVYSQLGNIEILLGTI